MTLALLQATGAGKVANKLKKSQTALAVRARARRQVEGARRGGLTAYNERFIVHQGAR